MSFEPSTDHLGLPMIDPAAVYDTQEAAALLFESASVLRRWRLNKLGPRYSQHVPGGRVTYLGQWLIDFRELSVKSPAT